MAKMLRKLRLLLYKNFLVRKRQWISALFLQILLPCFMFYDMNPIKLDIAPGESSNHTVQNTSYPKQMIDTSWNSKLFLVLDPGFSNSFVNDVVKCLNIKQEDIQIFQKESDMLDEYKKIRTYSADQIGTIVFQDNSFSEKQLNYKIYTNEKYSTELYYSSVESFEQLIMLQTCLDTTFITFNNSKANLHLSMQKISEPGIPEENNNKLAGIIVAVLLSLVFMLQLCLEVSKSAEEKFLGVNVLMAMNGVPNYLNLLSWLLSGLVFGLFYVIPMIIFFNIPFEGKIPFLHNGNSFIFWLVITLHSAHLFTFGMHISAYFTRAKFLSIGLLVIYIIPSSYSEFYLKSDSLVPYLGIIFPNILLIRACREIGYYQAVTGAGIHWKNLFEVDELKYGTAGSLGVIMIFSILGAILHFALANYICAVNPGKYGAKKNPLYFLEFFRKPKNFNDYEKIENYEPSNNVNKPFEQVSKEAFIPGIQLRNLKKMYNVGLFGNAQVHALKGISIDFYKGQITSLLGHNGAGKTTMMSILTGMNHATEGTVVINGKNAKIHLDEIMTDMGLCPQENIVFPNLSIYEQFKLFAMLKNKNYPDSVVEQNVEGFLRKLKLYEKRNILPKKLSGGQKRRVCLGMALVGDPSILILDEPTSGLDPEVKRSIWDILLKTRGEKTIIISTHDMEEADILGDRIAIVHSGTLRSYGTPMFLKKHLGRGNVEVTLSTEPWSNPESIRTYLGNRSELLSADGSKIIMSVPYTPELPDGLDRTESHKNNLGITGMSVSLITLEQVFLRVTEEGEDAVDDREPLVCASSKLEGWERSWHAAKGLLYKKATYTWKNLTTFIIMTALILLTVFIIKMILPSIDSSTDTSPIDIKLDMYKDSEIYFTMEGDSDPSFENSYSDIVNQYKGTAKKLNGNLDKELLDLGFKNYRDYKTRMIAAATYYRKSNFITATAMYNDKIATYAVPISLNLLTNGILKALNTKEHEIKMSAQTFPSQSNNDMTWVTMTFAQFYSIPLVLVIFLITVVALLIIHPLLENATNIKHLQKMTGLSAFNYWGTMLIFDLVVMVIFSIIIIIGFIVTDQVQSLNLFGGKEILILSLLLFLFSLSVLPCIYCFTFIFSTTNVAMKFLTLLPTGLVILEVIMILLVKFLPSPKLKIIRPIEKGAVLLTPYVGFFHGTVSFFNTTASNFICRQLSISHDSSSFDYFQITCQTMQCNDGKCANPNKFFNNFEGDVTLEGGLLSLGVTFVLYSVILWMLENKLIPMLIIKAHGDERPPSDDNDDELVKKVKRDLVDEIDSIKAESSKIIANSRTIDNVENGVLDKSVFLVHGLRKKYGSLVAVQDINFNVKQGECFGLLGVNGAGKSTAFRMMTGEEIPHNGVMFLSGKDLTKTSSRSEMGYCPQNDALVTSLNAYDHLRLFARLRGIPEHEVHKEVNKWIKRLNLTVPGRNPSGTYSGGNKRRLNIAISMIGLPNLVLLDEPTTGVDPAARRSLWNVIKSAQTTTGQAVILTSHSMEECEALCRRLAIMVNGKFVCIGPSEELKQRFGAGYDIQIKLNPEKAISEIEGIKRDIEASLQCELVDENSGYLMYHVSFPETKWRKMYDVMSQIKHKYSSIDDFSVLSSTLEQLFLLFARAANKSH